MKKEIDEKTAKIIMEKIPDVLMKSLKIVAGIEKRSNETLKIEGGYISYNANTDQGEETALCSKGEFFILLGDYRKDLKDCKTLAQATKVFKKLLKNGAELSPWSTMQ